MISRLAGRLPESAVEWRNQVAIAALHQIDPTVVVAGLSKWAEPDRLFENRPPGGHVLMTSSNTRTDLGFV